MKRLPKACLLVLSFFLAMKGTVKGEPLVADLGDHLVAITTGFTGTNILLFGAIEEAGDIIAVIHGPPENVKIRRKEKFAGIWVNRDLAEFSHVPVYYDIASTRPLNELVTPEIRMEYHLGSDYLPIHRVEKENGDIEDALPVLIRLKQSQGLFRDQQSRIIFVGQNLFRLNVTLPASVPTGSYMVEVYAVRDGKIVAAQTTPLIVGRVGFSADLYHFAYQHSSYYGLAAILIALGLGWGAHLIFRRR